MAHNLAALEEDVQQSLQRLAYPARPWVKSVDCPDGSGKAAYDVVVIGGGQCGLTCAFGLMREQVTNILVLDENQPGQEGPWVTYARMVTLRTPKELTGPDLGVPCLTFQSYYEARHGLAAWEALDKIPRGEWMDYLVWYRRVLRIPLRNSTKVDKISPVEGCTRGTLFKLSLLTPSGPDHVYARKVVLATGIQGGGEWHVPPLIREAAPRHLYAHTSEAIDFDSLRGKRVAVLGGGASAFDNAQYGLERGVAEVHVFVRRPELPRVNPIRHMEFAGFLRHFSDLDDATKYAGVAFFLSHNQPPTNDTFARASRFPGFHLHTGAPWTALQAVGEQVRVTTPKGSQLFDFLIISTGLLTDTRLRPELREVADHIATWADRYSPPAEAERNALLDAHPYLGLAFEYTERAPGSAPYLAGLFAYNYSALASLGLSASALSGMKYAVGKLVGGITKQLFLDDQDLFIPEYLAYRTEEFLGVWPGPAAEAAEAADQAAAPPALPAAAEVAGCGAREQQPAAATAAAAPLVAAV